MTSMCRGSRLLIFGAAAASLPIYVTAGSPFLSVAGTAFSSFTLGGFSAHWSLLIGPATLLWLGITGRFRVPTFHLPAVGTALAWWLAFCSGLAILFLDPGNLVPLLGLAQILLPVSMLYVGLAIGYAGLGMALLRRLFLGLLAFQGVLIMSNWVALLANQSHSVALRFPQFLTYYPGVVAFGVLVAWSQRKRSPILVILFLGSAVFLAPTIWSRLGLGTLLIAFMFYGLAPSSLNEGGGLRTQIVGRLFRAISACVLIGVIIVTALAGTLGQRILGKSSVLETGRTSLMLEALARILQSPLYGDAGQALSDRADFGGYEGQGLKLFPAHNQILDLGIRGGLVAVALGLACTLALIFLALRLIRRSPSTEGLVGAGSICIVLFASLSDLYFSQAVTASPAWLLIGTAWGAYLADVAVVRQAVASCSLAR